MKTVRTWCIRILMILFTIIFLYPLFWNLMSAFKTNAEYLTDPYALPVSLNLDNFVAAWQKANIAAYFGNSVFVTVLSTALLLLFVIPISYVLARYRFAGSKLISTIYMACIFLQATYIMIPLFLELQAINGLNNLPVLCLVYAVMQFPFCIFTLQGFMSAVPKDFEESARIDGATNLQLLLKVMVPLAKPGIATLTMFYGVTRWNEYFRSGIYISSIKKVPLQVILRKFIVDSDVTTIIGTQNLLNYNDLAKIDYTALQYATIVIAVVPILLIYPLVLKYYTKGIMAGGVKE